MSNLRNTITEILTENLEADIPLKDFEDDLQKRIDKRYSELRSMLCEILSSVLLAGPFEGTDLLSLMGRDTRDVNNHFHMNMYRFKYNDIRCEVVLVSGEYPKDFDNETLAQRCISDYRELLDDVDSRSFKSMVSGWYQGMKVMIAYSKSAADAPGAWVLTMSTDTRMVKDIVHQMVEERGLIL